ncbi:Sre G protein-coupled chemoreceptor [Oesophagostomum dentatum]|uniref:Sre G protein-coupled chemoreceptor n=1 Tax=Oesophagostomum dentatum TaxID=61180 RepID=A0A0B1TLW5_OESDE|nr:Sre G protein-coupled chemoreceptor [Oesophagostomum dentatum]
MLPSQFLKFHFCAFYCSLLVRPIIVLYLEDVIPIGSSSSRSPLFRAAWFVNLFCRCTSLSSFTSVLIERYFASHFVSDYEKKPRKWIAALVVLSSCALAALYTTQFFVGFFSVIGFAIFIFSVCTVCSAVYIILYRRDKRRLRLLFNDARRLRYRLSTRFQLAENLRVLKVRFLLIKWQISSVKIFEYHPQCGEQCSARVGKWDPLLLTLLPSGILTSHKVAYYVFVHRPSNGVFNLTGDEAARLLGQLSKGIAGTKPLMRMRPSLSAGIVLTCSQFYGYIPIVEGALCIVVRDEDECTKHFELRSSSCLAIAAVELFHFCVFFCSLLARLLALLYYIGVLKNEVVYVMLYRREKRQLHLLMNDTRRIRYKLATRFQLTENLRVLKTVAPANERHSASALPAHHKIPADRKLAGTKDEMADHPAVYILNGIEAVAFVISTPALMMCCYGLTKSSTLHRNLIFITQIVMYGSIVFTVWILVPVVSSLLVKYYFMDSTAAGQLFFAVLDMFIAILVGPSER